MFGEKPQVGCCFKAPTTVGDPFFGFGVFSGFFFLFFFWGGQEQIRRGPLMGFWEPKPPPLFEGWGLGFFTTTKVD